MGNIEHIEELEHQLTDLSKKVEELEQQLKEANKLIKWVVKTSWSGNQEEDDFDRYLERYGVE